MKNLSLLFIAFLYFQFTSSAQVGWFNQLSGVTNGLGSVYFINNDLGWVVGVGGTILKTTNGGDEWNLQNLFTEYNLNDVFFIDSLNGWIVGDEAAGTGNIILRTTDSGVNWTETIDISNRRLTGVYFVNNQTGWTIANWVNNGFGAYMHKSTDGGITWIAQGDSLTCYESIFFISSDIGWLTGQSSYTSKIYKTTNGGANWLIQDSLEWNRFIDIYFIDELNGWVSADGGDEPNSWIGIYRSTNGGIEWELSFENTALGPSPPITFADNNNGWFVTKPDFFWMYSRIYHTTNGGDDWARQECGNKKLHSIYFVDENNGWAVGENGTILHTTTGGVVSVDEEANGIPNRYNLTQNFPNPFNPTTKIRYSVPNSSNVTIKVFDILGNEIETLVNEEKLTGTYEVTWYAEGLPSGIYFYRLQADDFIQTKKMVLMK